MTKAERERVLVERAAERIKGLRTEPYMGAFLDLCDRLDAEAVQQTVDSLFAEIGRSGNGGGFLLEVFRAATLLDVSPPRRLRCEQKEGMSKNPGDVWLDFEGRRYEFPCKDALNWTVEWDMAAATDAIAAATRDHAPGMYYKLEPELEAPPGAWKHFAETFVAEYRSLQADTEYEHRFEGRPVARFRLFGHRHQGVILGIGHSPGGVQRISLEMLRAKLKERLQGGKNTLSALPSETQLNCLVFDVVNYTVGDDDVFQALYGDHGITIDSNGSVVGEALSEDGLWRTGRYEAYSAVVFQRNAFDKDNERFPISVRSTVFPHPARVAEVRTAFANIPNHRVVESLRDVGL